MHLSQLSEILAHADMMRANKTSPADRNDDDWPLSIAREILSAGEMAGLLTGDFSEADLAMLLLKLDKEYGSKKRINPGPSTVRTGFSISLAKLEIA